MTMTELEQLVAFQHQQITDLTAERDRLRAESTNASNALSASNANNTELIEQNKELEQEIVDIVEEVYNSDLAMIGE